MGMSSPVSLWRWGRLCSGRFNDGVPRIVKAAELAGNIREAYREHNITDQIFYRWRRKYGGMGVSVAKKLRGLERESSELKRMVVELSLDNRALKELNSREW